MKKLIALALLVGGMYSCNQPVPDAAASMETIESEATTPQPTEFADETYSDLCKQGLAAMAGKDIDGFVSNFADDAVYVFNNGDSIAGKQAINDYWTDRMTNTIDKIEFSNDIWLSLKVNESTQGVRTGNWVMGWFNVVATYSATGKSMTQNIHTLYHFNNDGKFDRVIQYLDRAAIMAAMTKD